MTHTDADVISYRYNIRQSKLPGCSKPVYNVAGNSVLYGKQHRTFDPMLFENWHCQRTNLYDTRLMATHVNYSTNSPDMAVLLIRRMLAEEPNECVSIDFERSMWPGENQSQNALCIGTTNTTVVFHGPLVCFTARTVLQ